MFKGGVSCPAKKILIFVIKIWKISSFELYTVGQAITGGDLILLHVYFMVGGGDLNQSMASISIEKLFLSFIILGVWGDMVFFLSHERGKMNRKEMEIEMLLLQRCCPWFIR